MKEPKLRGRRRPRASALAAVPEEQAFAEVVEMIQASRSRALAAVNTALIDLYWRVGGEGVVEALARYILKVTDEAGTGVTIYGQEKDAQELLTGRIRLV